MIITHRLNTENWDGNPPIFFCLDLDSVSLPVKSGLIRGFLDFCGLWILAIFLRCFINKKRFSQDNFYWVYGCHIFKSK